jgi:hypothetical protein
LPWPGEGDTKLETVSLLSVNTTAEEREGPPGAELSPVPVISFPELQPKSCESTSVSTTRKYSVLWSLHPVRRETPSIHFLICSSVINRSFKEIIFN